MHSITQQMGISLYKINDIKQKVAGKTAAWIAVFAITLCGLLLAPTAARAQVLTADVVGTVTDAAGSVLPNATVTVTNRGTNDARVTKSSDSGDFAVTLLPVGNYSVKVESPGFKTYTSSFALSGGDRARVAAKLEVGQTTETIEVTTQAPALQTDTSTLASTVTQASVQNLPLNGRNFISLATLAPGATQGGPNAMSGGNRPDDRRQSSAISVNGQYETMNNYMVDGMDNNDRYIGTIGVRPSVDAMQEFSVKTNLYTADVTRTAGGVINVITKSGTNEFHGTLFEFLRNDIVDANAGYNFSGSAPLAKGKYRQNQFGGSIGGPIIKNKTFFFGDYENLRIIQGVAFTDRQVPTAAEKSGDFSSYLAKGIYINDPALCPVGQLTTDPNYTMCHSTGAAGPVFPGNIIPASRIDSTIKNLLALFPAPTGSAIGAVNYQNNVARTQFQTTFDIRVDHHISDTDTIFGRYSYNDTPTFTPNAFPVVGGINGGGCNCSNGNGQTTVSTGSYSGTAKQRSQNAQINYSHVFSPALVLQARVGYLRYAMQSLPDNTLGAPNAATTVGIPNVNNGTSFGKGLPQMSMFPYSSLGDQLFIPEFVYEDTYQHNDDLHYTKGSHSIAAGFMFIRRFVFLNQSQQPRGWWAFNTTAPSGYTVGTNNSFADFLIDMPQTFQRAIQLVDFGSIGNEWGAYAQDDWRATKNLTLNLGVRWDYFSPFAARNGYMAGWNTDTNQLMIPGQTGVNNRANTPSDFKDWAPRVGFAATVAQGLVIRGGFGMSYYPGITSNGPYMENVPFFFSSSANCGVGQATICPTLKTGSPVVPSSVDMTLAQNANLNGSVTGMSRHLKSAYVEQWSLNVQKDFHGNVVSIGYVGNAGHRGPAQINQNLGVNPSSVATPSSPSTAVPRPLTAAGVFHNSVTGKDNSPTVNVQTNKISTNYNSMQITLDRRTSRGLTVNAQYTFAKAMSNAGGTQSITGGGTGQWIANLAKFDYGRTGLDARHHIAVLIAYELPFAKGMSGPIGYMLKGWQANTVYQYRSGLPFTVLNPSGRLNITGGGADRPNRIAPVQYPHTLKQWFNPAAFQLNPIGFPGTEQAFSLDGTPYRTWDLSTSKNFPIREGDYVQFRVEGFNILNTPNFLNPNATIPGTSFDPATPSTWGTMGNISGLTGAPRQFQFAAKVVF